MATWSLEGGLAYLTVLLCWHYLDLTRSPAPVRSEIADDIYCRSYKAAPVLWPLLLMPLMAVSTFPRPLRMSALLLG